jgi:tetratricopeptide (TPR) repeat protein
MTTILVMDLDETVLTIRPNITNDHVVKTASSYNPYLHDKCYTLNKKKLTEIFNNMIVSGGKIAISTSSTLPNEDIQKFFQMEFNIEIDPLLIFHGADKNDHLFRIKKLCDSLIFVDNRSQHITEARDEGFHSIYADTNNKDSQNNSFIDVLHKAVLNRTIIYLWRNSGEVCIDKKDSKGAAHCYKQAARVSHDPLDWLRSSTAYEMISDRKSAQYCYLKFCRLTKSASSWENLAKMYIESKRHSDAAQAYLRAYKVGEDPKNLKKYKFLTDVYKPAPSEKSMKSSSKNQSHKRTDCEVFLTDFIDKKEGKYIRHDVEYR